MDLDLGKTRTELVEESQIGKINIWYVKRQIKNLNSVIEKAIANNEYIAVYMTPMTNRPQERILIDYTPTPMGGYKLWLVCPICGKHRMDLYASPFKGVKCRSCHNYKYRSQYRRKADAILAVNDFYQMAFNKRRMFYAGKPTRHFIRFIRRSWHGDELKDIFGSL